MGNLQIGVFRQADDPADRLLPGQKHICLLKGCLAAGQAQQHLPGMLSQFPAQAVRQPGIKRIAHVRQNDLHRTALTGAKGLSLPVDPIAQLIDGLLHTGLVAFPHGHAVNHPGNRSQSDSGLPGHVFHGDIPALRHGNPPKLQIRPRGFRALT